MLHNMETQVHYVLESIRGTQRVTTKNKNQYRDIEIYRESWSETCKALSTCSGAIVLFSSLLQTSFDSDEMRFINSAKAQNKY